MQAALGFEDDSACAQCCPNLSYTHRLYGFFACSGIGFLLSSIGSAVLFSGFTEENITTFSILYIGGNVMSLGGTLFLCGPKKQCIKMWDKTRRFSTFFYLTMLIVVFAVAITKQIIWIILAMLLIEIAAAVWYSASFIPFGRAFIMTCLRGSICMPCAKVYDWCAVKCGSAKESVQKATSTGSHAKKSEGGWFGGETKKESGGWFGGKEEPAKSGGGGWFGGGSEPAKQETTWWGGTKEPEPTRKSGFFGGSVAK